MNEGVVNPMLEAIGTAVPSVLSWIGDVLTALTSESGDLHALLPIFAIGIGVSASMFAIKAIRGIAWGA